MDKKRKKGKLCGQITVFLTLILLVLLSFVGMLVKSGRIHVLRNYSEGNLRLAVESIFTRYCRPLWEEYHLLFMEGEEQEEEKVKSMLKHYIGEIKGSFYKEKSVDFQVEEIVLFTDYQGEIYLNQMVEYMKFHFIQDIFQMDQKILEENEKAEVTAKVLEEKQQLEERLSVTNRYVLEVIRLIEGITVRNGKVKAEGTFVKQLCPEIIDASYVGVSRNEMWEKLKGKYILAEDMTHGKARGILRMIEQALIEIEKIEKEEGKLSREVSNFTNFYESEKENMVEGIGEVIETELGGIGNYEITENSPLSMTSQVKRMKQVLLQNKGVLEAYLSCEEEEEGKEILKTYNISGLRFNYSGLALKKQKSPLKEMDKILSKSILSMVIKEEDKLSQRIIPQAPDFIYDRKSLERKETILEKAIEVSYYQKHFNCYTDSKLKKEILYKYEQEYLITGGETEKEALGSVVNRLFLTRQMFNYMYLISDSQKSNEAYGAAMAMVGFTGMGPLISVTKHLILLNWARAEALVDISLLLEGKKIDLWKNTKSFQITFEEMIGFNKEMLHRKVSEHEVFGGLGKQDYRDYLRIYLFLTGDEKRKNRSLNLIQENLRYRYYNDFSIVNGICGMKITGNWNYGDGYTIIRTINYCY